MPIYEYRCSSCGHELEALQKFSDTPLLACPSCNTNALVKLMSASGFQLKGSGWYATDFKNSGSKPAPPKGDGDAKAAAQTEHKGDGKPEGKSEGKSEGKGDSQSEGKRDTKGEARSDTKSETKSDTKSDAASSAKVPASGTGAPPAST